jgi:hypothetical protein
MVNYHSDWIEIATDNKLNDKFSNKLELINGKLFIHASANLYNDDVIEFLQKYLSEKEIIDLYWEVFI